MIVDDLAKRTYFDQYNKVALTKWWRCSTFVYKVWSINDTKRNPPLVLRMVMDDNGVEFSTAVKMLTLVKRQYPGEQLGNSSRLYFQ